MNFILSKFLTVLILSNVYLGTDFDLPRNDLIIVGNGEEIKCRVQSVEDGKITAATKDGERIIIREIKADAARDMAEAGIVKTTRYSGRITYLDDEYLQIKTYAGDIRIPKEKLRKVIISQESASDL